MQRNELRHAPCPPRLRAALRYARQLACERERTTRRPAGRAGGGPGGLDYDIPSRGICV